MLTLDYDLLDFGNGHRLERFGPYILKRPDKGATKTPVTRTGDWQFDAECLYVGAGLYRWEKLKLEMPDNWVINLGDLKLEVRLSQSKNIGVFPEQLENWNWLYQAVQGQQKPLKLLNLFAYTGVASLVAAQAGAQVCHVDAAKSTVQWASRNQKLSGLEQLPIRWIVDSAVDFMRREIKREVKYDGVILDPPPLGRTQKGTFRLQDEWEELVSLTKKVLVPKPRLFLFNTYAEHLTTVDVLKMLKPQFPDVQWSAQELLIESKQSSSPYQSGSVAARFLIL